jgi:class 3 adenylate cyclase/tetratricopeptide (TPR) repeat protein
VQYQTSDPKIRPESSPILSARAAVDPGRASRYFPRILHQHLIDDPQKRHWTADGTAVFVDISGFTKLSERLARKGREGAEQITAAIGDSFDPILNVAYENGGSLLKFGGDALLLWFRGDDHVNRAVRTAILMRRVLREAGRIEVPGAKVQLRMSQGVHTGRFHFFAVGTSHLELLPTGPAWSHLVALEHAATAGEILMSKETAALVPSRCAGAAKHPGMLVRREPPGQSPKLSVTPRPPLPFETIAHCLSPAIRTHVMAGGGTSEHRPVTIAFVHFDGIDALIEEHGADAAADALAKLVNTVDAAVEEQGVAFLASDVDADGGKLILTAGAPIVTGDDEERMLLALRRIVESNLPFAIRIGVNRGSVFAGDIGPTYRTIYTVMGDAVNLAARLMAKAKPGEIYATADVLDRSNTLFETTELEPFAVKGKAKPVQAWSVGKARGSRKRHIALERLPLVGRDAELSVIHETISSARSRVGRLVEVAGEAGIGKTRLLETLRDEAKEFRQLHASCEAYTASTPYALWREILREMMSFGRDDPEDAIVERLKQEVASRSPDLAPWLPLIGIALDVEIAPTPEVEQLAEANRRAILHRSVRGFLKVMLPEPTLIEIENAHHMDEASAEFLAYLAERIDARPWLFGVARRPSDAGFKAPDAPTVVRIVLEPLAPNDALRMVQLASEKHSMHMHVIEVVAKRSGGNPQFLRDLLNSAINTGGVEGLPDSAEAAVMARIDALVPEDRALVRRAAVLGQSFHPRMLAWLADDGELALPGPAAWERMKDLFVEEPDGYLQFRRSLLRDAAYEGLPYKLRRRLHSAVATQIAREANDQEEVAGILSLHCLAAGDSRSAWRYATLAAKRAAGVYAYLEAAQLYARALDAGRRLDGVTARELSDVHRALADSFYRTGEFTKAGDAYDAARRLIASDPLASSELMLKLSHVTSKLGEANKALRWTRRARAVLKGLEGKDATRQAARLAAWCGMLLQYEGRTKEALKWAECAMAEGAAADNANVLGEAYCVMGWAYRDLGRDGALVAMRRSLEEYQRAGNLVAGASALSNVGAVCEEQGRWDDALSYFQRSREANLKIGGTFEAGVARINIAEILSHRGEWAEAEALLLQELPFWKASKYRFFLGACLAQLGRVSLRTGRFGEALGRLEDAKAHFLQAGAELEIPGTEAWIAECRIGMGDVDAALDLVSGLLARASSSSAARKVVPQLQRVRAYALLRKRDRSGARGALEAGVAAARERRNLIESALAMLALIELDRLEGVEPSSTLVAESSALVASLRIRAVPPLPCAG